MDILSYNPGHDGAVALLRDEELIFSLEAEKDSNWRYSAMSPPYFLGALGQMDELPDVVCSGGWWPREEFPTGVTFHANYRGIAESEAIIDRQLLVGKPISYFSSSHERSHLLCGFGMSPFPQGEPCYALVWEGVVGAFYEIDKNVNIKLIADVMHDPGNRYSSIYGLADPTFPKTAPWSRYTDAGKLMALASFAQRSTPTLEEEKVISYILNSEHFPLDLYDHLRSSVHYNAGVEDPEFKNFAGIFSDRIFEVFYQFAKANLEPGRPLIISGGCGLNCDWNSRWRDTGLFSDVFIPPVPNDAGSAIGTAVDAQRHFTGRSKIRWNVYSGLPFDSSHEVPEGRYDISDVDYDEIAKMLQSGLILGWANGLYEIGPRALGNRSILAAPFEEETRVRLNVIKEREQFRPIAPVCLEDDAARWFDCPGPSPYMLFTYRANTTALKAVTHVNGTARLQSVSETTNHELFRLLEAFKRKTGFGVLCNTSLNFSGKGFINNLADLDRYATDRGLDGFVANGRAYMSRGSEQYLAYRGMEFR